MKKIFIDLTGLKFNHITVLYRVSPPINSSQQNSAHFLCKCDCGKEIILPASVVKKQKSCGCKKRNSLLNKKFNKLSIINRVPRPLKRSVKTRDTFYNCKCDCGNYIIAAGGDLQRGSVKSCGCLRQFKGMAQSRFATAKSVYLNAYADGDISFKEFLYLCKKVCHYCGAEPSNEFNRASIKKGNTKLAIDTGKFVYNGLDRVDNMLGHIKSNVVPCCWMCNSMKRNYKVSDFLNQIKLIFEFQNKLALAKVLR